MTNYTPKHEHEQTTLQRPFNAPSVYQKKERQFMLSTITGAYAVLTQTTSILNVCSKRCKISTLGCEARGGTFMATCLHKKIENLHNQMIHINENRMRSNTNQFRG